MRLLINKLIIFGVLLAVAQAADPDERLSDPELEARAQQVGLALRCVVCKSQSIEDSDAPLARDLRILVRERIKSGDNNQEVLDYVAARYGDYVLLKPPLQANTWALWAAPSILLLGAMLIGLLFLRTRNAKLSDTLPLSPAEEAALAKRDDITDSSAL